jgi:hypothetical protein
MNPAASETITNPRWSRVEVSGDFFCDADRLRACFYGLAAAGGALLAAFALGLWRLQAAALAPPVVVGIAHGQIFSGPPQTLASVREDDFDAQLADTVEVLFGRTEKGQPREIADYCAPEVVAAVARSYSDLANKYPAGYVQTLDLLETRVISSRPGWRRVYFRGLLSSRSVAAAQTSPVYLDGTFVIRPPAGGNTTGWRLMALQAIGAEEFYRRERERAVRQALSLPAVPGSP